MNTLSNDNIRKIANAYGKLSETAGFSRAVDIKEIVDNNYNLNISLYVMPIEEAEKISISKVYSELKKLEEERKRIEKELDEVLDQIKEIE